VCSRKRKVADSNQAYKETSEKNGSFLGGGEGEVVRPWVTARNLNGTRKGKGWEGKKKQGGTRET